MAKHLKDKQSYINELLSCRSEEDRPITLDGFAYLILSELGLSREEVAGLVARTETKLLAGMGLAPTHEHIFYYADEHYKQLREVSREDAAIMMAEAYHLIGIHTDINNLDLLGVLTNYKDMTLVAEWAKPAMALAVCKDWITCGNAEMKPKNFVTPHEAIIIAQRFAETALS